MNEATVAYTLEVHKYFEDLRQVASQIAGILVLHAAGGQTATPDHPMLEQAVRMHREAIDGLQRTRTTDQARRHHGHLLQAGAALADAIAAMRKYLHQPEIDPLVPLRAGYAELEHAAATLPGFEMVSFERGCCAQKGHE